MPSNVIHLHDISPDELEYRIRSATKAGNAELTGLVQILISEIGKGRRVLDQEAAAERLRIGVETLKQKIKYHGLPAFKNGQVYYLYASDVEDWAMGVIGWEERSDTPRLIDPRHEVARQRYPSRRRAADRHSL